MFISKAWRSDELKAKLAALDKSQAVIDFDLDGYILMANSNFLSTVGYAWNDIKGKHHSLFVDPEYQSSLAYSSFWQKLKAGTFQAGRFKRIGKGGREIWIEATYNPILGRNGTPTRIVKYATDITAQMAAEADLNGQVAAIRKSQAVIAFDLDGTILEANENFLATVGYALSEIKGRHHSMFVDGATRHSADYSEFWRRLKAGEYQAAQYKRVGKGGREIWIQASYNPILDASGRPYKVVKFATDVTEQIQMLSRLRHMIDQNFGEIDRAMQQSDTEAAAAARAANETSGNVQTMAAASEQLAVSVAEVAQSMAQSRMATDTAFAQAQSAGQLTEHLSTAANAMGGIVSLIQTIAAQINLLALNATIEAARAGDAGKGFAVVATEVKNLAAQAARATDQISSEINSVQSVSDGVVDILQSIRTSVETMRDNIVSAAAAMEEQSAVTQEMSTNMRGASQAVSRISDGIASMSDALKQVNRAVDTTKHAAQVLAR